MLIAEGHQQPKAEEESQRVAQMQKKNFKEERHSGDEDNGDDYSNS